MPNDRLVQTVVEPAIVQSEKTRSELRYIRPHQAVPRQVSGVRAVAYSAVTEWRYTCEKDCIGVALGATTPPRNFHAWMIACSKSRGSGGRGTCCVTGQVEPRIKAGGDRTMEPSRCPQKEEP